MKFFGSLQCCLTLATVEEPHANFCRKKYRVTQLFLDVRRRLDYIGTNPILKRGKTRVRFSKLHCFFAIILSGTAWSLALGATVSLKLSPSTAKVNLYGSATFTLANVPAGEQLTWQLVSTAPGSVPDNSGTLGTIDSTGAYKAPAALPGTPTVSVQVVDHSNPSNILATATVTLVDPVKVSPASAFVRLGATQSFTASGVPTGVTIGWNVAGSIARIRRISWPLRWWPY
jgi:hypothetical protein